MARKYPDRWLDYSKFGSQVEGTSFIPLKVPLNKKFFNKRMDDSFTPQDAIDLIPNLGLVIDLTFTSKYYNPSEFLQRNVQHKKIFTKGHEVPKRSLVNDFIRTVNNFLADEQNKDKLIGVHCTHGLNRTGYFVCAFMILVQGQSPKSAINLFNQARAHPMERENYLNALHQFIPLSHTNTDQGEGAREDSRDHFQNNHHNRNNDHRRKYDACGGLYEPNNRRNNRFSDDNRRPYNNYQPHRNGHSSWRSREDRNRNNSNFPPEGRDHNGPNSAQGNRDRNTSNYSHGNWDRNGPNFSHKNRNRNGYNFTQRDRDHNSTDLSSQGVCDRNDSKLSKVDRDHNGDASHGNSDRFRYKRNDAQPASSRDALESRLAALSSFADRSVASRGRDRDNADS